MTTASELIADTQPGTTWILDRDRSTVTVRNKTFWGAVPVKGTFSDIEGSGEITAANTIAGHLRVGAASGSTGIGGNGTASRATAPSSAVTTTSSPVASLRRSP